MFYSRILSSGTRKSCMLTASCRTFLWFCLEPVKLTLFPNSLWHWRNYVNHKWVSLVASLLLLDFWVCLLWVGIFMQIIDYPIVDNSIICNCSDIKHLWDHSPSVVFLQFFPHFPILWKWNGCLVRCWSLSTVFLTRCCRGSNQINCLFTFIYISCGYLIENFDLSLF